MDQGALRGTESAALLRRISEATLPTACMGSARKRQLWSTKETSMNATAPYLADEPNTIRTADNTRLFYRDWGQGTPLVFLSGWTLNSDMWAYQMEPLSRLDCRCIAYDRRGHGRSSDPGPRLRLRHARRRSRKRAERARSERRHTGRAFDRERRSGALSDALRFGARRPGRVRRARGHAVSAENRGQPERHRRRFIRARPPRAEPFLSRLDRGECGAVLRHRACRARRSTGRSA